VVRPAGMSVVPILVDAAEATNPPRDQVRDNTRQDERRENSVRYRENVDRVNRSRDIEMERVLSSVRR
jgi:hypothetical protein